MDVRFSRFEIVTGTGALFLCLAFIAVFMEAGAIEAQVGRMAAEAVTGDDLYWVAVEPQGQHVVLSGVAAGSAAGERVARAAAAAPGVTGVTNRIDVLGADGSCQGLLEDHLRQHAIVFRPGRPDLTDASFATLEAIAGILRGCSGRFEIASHTDGDGDGSVNAQLSQRRAETVMRYLVQGGVDPARLTAVGYGDRQPVTYRSGQALSAGGRLEIRILGGAA